MINFWKLAYETVKKQRDQYKEENEQLREQFDYRNQSYMKLYEENEQLKEEKSKLEQIREIKDSALKGADIKIKALERENHNFKKRNALLMNAVDDLDKENKALRLQADTYFDEWQNEKLRCENEELKGDD